MATRRSEWLAAIKPILDKDAAKKDAVSLAKELGDILEVKVDASPENLDDLTKEFNEQLKTMGKQPIVFSEKTLRGIVSQFTNAISEGVSAGIAKVDFKAELEKLNKKREEIEKRQNTLKNKQKRYETAYSMIIDDLPDMDDNKFKAFNKDELEQLKKAGGDIDKIASDMIKKANDAIWGLKEIKQGTSEFYEALEDTLEKSLNVFRMSRTLNNKPDLLKNKDILEEYDFDYLKDTFGEDLGNYTIDLSNMINKVSKEIDSIPLKLKEIDNQLSNIQKNGVEIIDLKSTKDGLKTLNEIQEAYEKLRKKKSLELTQQSKLHIESALNFDPTTSGKGIQVLYDQYREAAASGDWVEEYRALVKYVRLYESYITTTNKTHNNKITKRGNEFSPLYEELKPMYENAQNMLQNILNLGESKPLVGMGGAEKDAIKTGPSPEDVANAQKLKEETEAKARAEKESAEADRQKRIEEEKTAKAAEKKKLADEAAAEANHKAAEESKKERDAKESIVKSFNQIGYHFGNLLGEKNEPRDTFGQTLDNLTKEADPGTPSSYGYGILGGGLFYVNDPKSFGDEAPSKGSKFIQGIDFSKYNLYLATTEERVINLASLMSNLQRFAVKQAIPEYDGFNEQLKNVSIDTLWQQMQVVFENVDMTKQEFNQFIQEMVELLQNSGAILDKETKKLMFDNISEDFNDSDNISTRLLKRLGYQGVNTSNTSFDGMAQGSVLFDFKEEDVVAFFENVNSAIEHYNRMLDGGDTSSIEESLRIIKEIDAIIERINTHKTIMSEATSGKFDTSKYDATIKALESRKLMLQEHSKKNINEANVHKQNTEEIKKETAAQEKLNATEDKNPQTHEEIKKEALSYDELRQKVEAYIKVRQQMWSLMDQNQPWQHLLPDVDAASKEITSLFPDSGGAGVTTANMVGNMLQNQVISDDHINSLARALGIEVPQAAKVAEDAINKVADAQEKLNNESDVYDDLFDKTVKALEKSNDAFDDYERELASSGQVSIDEYRNGSSIPERARRLIEEGFVDQNTEWVDNDEYEYEDIKKENGALEDKLELLRDIAEQYGMNISQKQRDAYERLNQKDMDSGLTPKEDERYWELGEQIEEADNALEEFGETYDKIIVKLANGKKVEILPNDKGLSALAKIDDEFGETYNGVEIDDVIFERVKQEASGAEQSVDELNKSLEETHKLTSVAGTGAFSGDASSIELEAAQAEAEKLRLENDSLQDRLQSQADAMADEAYRNQEARGELYEMISNAEAERDAEKNRADSLQTELDQKSKEFTDKISYLETEVNFKDSEINDAYARAYESDAEAERLRDELARVKSSSKPEDAVEDKQSSVDTEELKTLLNSIVYNVKIVHDDADNVANKVALDEASLEITLTKVLTSILNPQTQQNDSNLDGGLSEIKSVLDSINDKIAKGGTITKKDKDVSRKTGNDSNNQSGRSTALKSLTGDYERLGKLRAQFEKDGNLETKARLKNLAAEVEAKRDSLKLTTDEILELKKKSDLAYKAEQRLIEAAKVQNAWEKQVKDAQRATGVNAATSAANSGDQTVLRAIGTEDISADIENKAKELSVQIKELRALRDEIDKKGEQASDADRDSLSKQITKVKELKTEVDGYLKIHEKYSGEGAKQFNDIDTSSFGAVGTNQYWNSITAAIKTVSDGRVAIKGMNADTGELSGTTKIAANTFATWSATVDPITGKLSILRTGIKKTETIIEQITRKTKEIFTYFSGSSIIFKAFNELKKGIQYIRDIDLALTELKKVTDETDETYDKFLETAAKTGAKLGTTISAVTEATATFAKLGYTMEQATEMAESAIVYKNVGDNIASTGDAADSIISTMKGFGLEASESMAIVDRFNEVANKFAITSQGIGEALRLSASALNEGGNSLDESIGMITAANEVVNDPSSVGTALKTLTLRLRGSKTE
jgi:hypothetical protein